MIARNAIKSAIEKHPPLTRVRGRVRDRTVAPLTRVRGRARDRTVAPLTRVRGRVRDRTVAPLTSESPRPSSRAGPEVAAKLISG